VRNYISIKRGGKLESRHQIHAAVYNSKQLVASVGNPDFLTYFRSSAKPYQTLTLFRTGVIDHFKFSDLEISLITASHNGEDFHIKAVRNILHKIGLDESYLRCGFHPPYFPAASEEFYASKSEPNPIYNNCSGKHAGMLAACVYHNYDLVTYLQPNHPHQRSIKQVVAEFSELAEEKIQVAIDGCGVPAFYLSLSQMAKMNVKFAISSEPAVQRIRNSIVNYPEYLAGTDRFDTDFIRVLDGRALTKVGAEAIQSFIFFEPEPFGIVVKCEDGNFRGVESAAIETLRQLNLISEEESEKLKNFWKPELKNHVGTIVGEITPELEVTKI
jgi:L-asparaginase II